MNLEHALIRLERALGPSKVVTDAGHCAPFACDESEADGVTPPCVIHAESADDVTTALLICDEERVPVVPRGGGTGRTGGATVLGPAVVIDTLALSRVKDIDRENLVAVVEPGRHTGVFQGEVEGEGLFFPPDPQSAEWCCLGGNVAENAGGPRAFKYGVTRDYVLGVECALMGGALLRAGKRTVKGVAGYDIAALLVGSEGTLGVFTELTLRLVAAPPVVRTLLVTFDHVVKAGRAVAGIVAQGLVPRCLELLDGICCEGLRDSNREVVGEGVGALLIIEVDGHHAPSVEHEVERIGNACSEVGALELRVARTEGERDAVWAVRKLMSRALRARARFKLSEDIVVPRSKIPAILQRVKEIAEGERVVMPAYGHAGDGNLHVNFLWDEPEDKPRVHRAIESLFRATLDLGGTITGEHGIGVLKAPYLPWEQAPELIALQRRVKQSFDPHGLLNPGKIFLHGERISHGSC